MEARGEMLGPAAGQERTPNSRRRAERAAKTPDMPWTPPPGGWTPSTGTRHGRGVEYGSGDERRGE